MGTWKAETDNHLPSLLRKTKLVSDQDILLISKKSIFSSINALSLNAIITHIFSKFRSLGSESNNSTKTKTR